MANSPEQSPMTRFRALSSAVSRARIVDLAVILAGGGVGYALAPEGFEGAAGLAAAILCGAGRLIFVPRRWEEQAEHLVADPGGQAADLPQAEFETELLAALPVAFLLLDEQENVLFCSHAARELLEINPVGGHISSVFRAPQVLSAVREAIAGNPPDSFDFIAHRMRERMFLAHISPLTHSSAAEGAPCAVLALEDVTRQRQTEQMRIDFVANASHELKTPLAAIGGLVETLRGPARDDPENRERFLGIIAAQTDRMGRLVSDLLSLSRIELEENTMPTEEVDLLAVLRDVCAALKPLAEESNVEFELDLPSALPRLTGDQNEIEQVFINLIGNAINYGGKGGRVSIIAAAPLAAEGTLSVSVRDYGPGIEPHDIPRLTERFYRIDKQDSLKRGGTGLGLAIVKHIMSRHRGALTIESEPGEGALFTVTFPVKTL